MFKHVFATALSALITVGSISPLHADVLINGAGATFPYPIYSRWFHHYNQQNPGIRINYQSIGSGGGIRQVSAKTVDFGATDGPMTDQQMTALSTPILHIPTVVGAVVPIFNLTGIKELNLDGPTLADIYLGNIESWDDPAIKALNPGVALPAAPITVIRRADASGTTYCFTDYLSKVSPEWKRKVGFSTSVSWPVGLGGKGNEGVSGLVKQNVHAIGYTELVYAKQNNISYAAVKNSSGKFIKADVESVTAAANAVAMPDDFRVSITNAPGEASYPISTYTWLLIYKSGNGDRAAALTGFL